MVISDHLMSMIESTTNSNVGGTSCLDLDSHADSPVLSENALIIEDKIKRIALRGFTNSLGSKTVPVVQAALAYDNINNNKTYILIINNALYIK